MTSHWHRVERGRWPGVSAAAGQLRGARSVVGAERPALADTAQTDLITFLLRPERCSWFLSSLRLIFAVLGTCSF